MVYESPTVEVEGKPLGELMEVRKCRIEVLGGDDAGKTLSFSKSVVRIGSDPLCDLVLTDRTVSRQHCEIITTGGNFKLSDLGSTNGTFVNDIKVGDVYLGHDSVFRAGKTRIKFTVETGAEKLDRNKIRYGDIIGTSPGIRDIFAILDKVAPTDLSVLIEGETGTGKELIARAIHEASARKGQNLVVFDCSSFPGSLLESELFGHEKGSFSGAAYTHKGVFERASGGTIFFDELGEMEIGSQAKFLRALETGEIRRVGGERTIRVDCRVVAATNRNLDDLMEEGRFRQDLFYRLAKVRFRLPPLRERSMDVPLLAEFFLEKMSSQTGRVPYLTDEAVDVLLAYHWPGNIRELRNVIERAAIMAGDEITGEYLEQELGLRDPAAATALGAGTAHKAGGHAVLTATIEGPEGTFVPLREAKDKLVSNFERQYLEELLEKHNQNISAAAREAQIDRRHFYRLLKKYGFQT